MMAAPMEPRSWPLCGGSCGQPAGGGLAACSSPDEALSERRTVVINTDADNQHNAATSGVAGPFWTGGPTLWSERVLPAFDPSLSKRLPSDSAAG
jgi:hypothetical protein